MLAAPRRLASATRHAARNRTSIAAAAALEQAGGMVASPVVVVALCSLLTDDLTDMVLPAIAAALAWKAGYAAAPLVLARAGRRLPWAVGASIVRAASLALLAYVLAGDDASRDQRLRSTLICVAAFALASGLGRGATESLAARSTSGRRPWGSQAVGTVLPAALALVVGVGAFALLVDVPRSPLPRLSALFGVGAVLSAAAVVFLARVVEPARLAMPRGGDRHTLAIRRSSLPAFAWLTTSSVSAAADLLLLVGLVRTMELPRAYVLSGMGTFVLASAVAATVLGAGGRSVGVRATLHLSAVASAVAFAVAVGLQRLVETDQSPDALLDRRPAEVGVWVVMALVGVAAQARRHALGRLSEHTSTPGPLINAAAVPLALAPLALAELLTRLDPRDWLLVGLAAALLALVTAGFVSPRPAVARSRPVLPTTPLSRPAARPIGGR